MNKFLDLPIVMSPGSNRIDIDENFMKQALNLAKQGAGKVSPNPMVGAVIVKDGNILGEGFHERFGSEHAEVNAIRNGCEKDSTLYITLEPCNHFGKTPPCTDVILNSKIKRVVIGSLDHDPRMMGKSAESLQKAGTEVVTGVLENEVQEMNRFYHFWKQTRLPYTTLKLALSKDEFYTRPDDSGKWISCEESRAEVHRMRSEFDAIMVGTQTVLMDDPSLTVRNISGRNPDRVILDRNGKIKNSAKVFDNNTQSIYFFSRNTNENLPVYVHQHPLNDQELTLIKVLETLGELNKISLLIEGGGVFGESLIREKLCREVIIYRSPNGIKVGKKFKLDTLPDNGYTKFEEYVSGVDKKTIYRLKNV